MKIVYFHQGYWPGNSPSTTFITYACWGFFQAGVKVKLLTGRRLCQPPPLTLDKEFGIHDPLPIQLITVPPVLRQVHLFLQWRSFCYLLCDDFDVLITRSVTFLPFAWWIKKIKGCSVYFESHDFFTDLSLRDEPKPRRLRKLNRLEKKYLPKMNGVFCVSRPQQLLYQHYYPGHRVMLAVTGAKPMLATPRRRPYNRRIGYIGSCNLNKYPLNILIQALALTSHNDINLLIIGIRNDDQLYQLQQITQQAGVAHRVCFYPWQGNVEIDRLKLQIDVGCAPLHPTFLNSIASPLKVLEYLAAGLPVIATKLPGISELLNDGKEGYLVKNEPAEWAQAIDRIYGDQDCYQAMVERVIQQANTLSWSNRAKRMLQEMVLDKKSE